MPFSVSPTVRIVEKDLSAIIPSTSNTTAAFVGRFDWGPTDTIVNISSEKELYAVFGPPNSNERGIDWWCAANFLSYGDKLKVVRVEESRVAEGDMPAYTGATAAAVRSGLTGARIASKSAGQKGNSLRWYTQVPGQVVQKLPSGEKVFSYTPTSTSQVFDSFNNGILTSPNGGGTMDECHIALVDTLGYFGATGAVLERFQGLSRWKGAKDSNGSSLYYKDVINRDSSLIEIESNPERSIWHGGTTGDPEWSPTTTSIKEHGLTAQGDPRGVYAGVEIAHIGSGQLLGGTANQHYYGGLGGVSGCDNCVQYVTYFQQGATVGIDNRLNDNGWRFVEGAASGVTWPYEGGGSDNTIPSGYTLNPNPYSVMNAWNKHFRDAEFVDVDLLIAGASEALLSRHLIEIAEERKDCVAFISPPHSPAGSEYNDNTYDSSLGGYSGPTSVVNYRNNTLNASSSYAVMDSGWKYQYDSYNDRYRWLPLNPDVAGLVVRTENQTDPWFSPAGFNRGKIKGVVKLALNPNKAERDELYEAGINPVVTFPGEGTLLFGDKTLQRRATALDRINVRRLMIHLEKAIATAAKYQLFEFNDTFTRRSFINMINPFLRRVQSQRGLTDFRVVCDESNNTGQVIDNNEFIADIFIKPAKSINYIQLNFTVLRSDALFEEQVV
jgi:hypothetical protein